MNKTGCLILVFSLMILVSGCFSRNREDKERTDSDFFPEVTLNLPQKWMYGHNNYVPLSGGLPEGGTYSGNGVRNNKFCPAAAGNGRHVITYTKFMKSATDTIVVEGVISNFAESKRCKTCDDKKAICPQCKKSISQKKCIHCQFGRVKKSCPKCSGNGFLRTWIMIKQDCVDCNSMGYIQEKCNICNGTWTILECDKCRKKGSNCPDCIL